MIELRHAGLAICAVLSIALVLGWRGAAQAQTAAPAQAPAPAAAPVQAPAQAPSPAPTAAAAAPAAAKPDACPRDKFRVVVDVGHTLDVPGAMSARGVTEYAFNLQLGQDADKALIDAGFGKTVLLITTSAPRPG